jgi:hypothetical protein
MVGAKWVDNITKGRIWGMREAGTTLQDIADKFDMPLSTVQTICERDGVRPKKGVKRGRPLQNP